MLALVSPSHVHLSETSVLLSRLHWTTSTFLLGDSKEIRPHSVHRDSLSSCAQVPAGAHHCPVHTDWAASDTDVVCTEKKSFPGAMSGLNPAKRIFTTVSLSVLWPDLVLSSPE